MLMTHPVTGAREAARAVNTGDSRDVAAAVRRVVPGQSSPSLLGLTIPPGTFLDDDDADGVMAALGYAWAVNADPKRTGSFDMRQSLWATDLSTVVVDVDLTGRLGKTRSNADAFSDLVCDTVRYLLEGAPVRRDGERLFEAPLAGLAVSDLRLWVSDNIHP